MSRPFTGSTCSPMSSTTRPRRSLTTRARAVAALQLLLEGQLDAFLALVLDVGEADDVRRGLALGVLALVLAQLVHALEPQRLDLAPQRLVDLAPAARRSCGCLRAVCSSSAGFMPSSLASALRCCTSASKSFGMAQIDGTGTLVASTRPLRSSDAAAAGRQLQRARIALLALLLEEVGADDLDVDRAAEQHGEGQADQRHHEAASATAASSTPAAGWWRSSGCARCSRPRASRPWRCGSSRADSAAATAPRPKRPARRVGHVLRDRRRGGAHRAASRAPPSRRAGGVACAWRSASRRLNSVSSWRSSSRAPVERGEQPPRFVRVAPGTGSWPAAQRAAAGSRASCRGPVSAGTAVRSATRMHRRARARVGGTSAAPGVTRASARSRDRPRRREGRAPVELVAALARDEGLDDAVLERVEADHDQPSSRVPAAPAPRSGPVRALQARR